MSQEEFAKPCLAGMANSLKQFLPSPVHQYSVAEDAPLYPVKAASSMLLDLNKKIPPYGGRKGWIPKTVEDFGDGGAFPEIHVLQYPLNMVSLLVLLDYIS